MSEPCPGLFERYCELGTQVGLSFVITPAQPIYNYDGNGTASFRWKTDNRDLFAHELAHFLIATPAERQMCNYGLGVGPDDVCTTLPRTTRALSPQTVESWASILGILIEKDVGDYYQGTWKSHNWAFCSNSKVSLVLKQLITDGHLHRVNGKLRPTYKVY